MRCDKAGCKISVGRIGENGSGLTVWLLSLNPKSLIKMCFGLSISYTLDAVVMVRPVSSTMLRCGSGSEPHSLQGEN